MKPPDKLLQDVVLQDYLSDVLGSANFVAISPTNAHKVEKADPQEEQCHVEWPNETNSYTKPHVWRIDDWRVSNTRFLRRKALHDHQRQIAVRASELRVAFIRQLQLATGLDEPTCKDMAESLINQRNVVSASIFKIDITELLEADQQLQEFKTKHNIK